MATQWISSLCHAMSILKQWRSTSYMLSALVSFDLLLEEQLYAIIGALNYCTCDKIDLNLPVSLILSPQGAVRWETMGIRFNGSNLRTFALIVSMHPYSARKLICHVMHRARTPSTKMNNERADGHCYSSRTFGDPYFSFQKHFIYNNCK